MYLMGGDGPPDQSTQVSICNRCWALVATRLLDDHYAWHIKQMMGG